MERILRHKEIFEIIPFDYSQKILYFPIRHHSPVCSYHLLRVIEAYKPDCILVEGPQNSDKLIPILTHEETKLPIAFYYYYKDTQKLISEDAEDYKCYYPFLNTSPEYNALLQARKRNIDCGFIDLPYGEILINSSKKSDTYNYDYYLSESKFFERLCEKTDMRSFEEFWENYFEINGLYMETDEFVANMMTYCYLTRENTPDEAMEKDGCLVREKFMAENILESAKTHQRILVVTGGFHTYGLYKLTSSNKKEKKLKIHNFNESIQNVYAMIYSFEAADALNGYASGMQNPGFYDKVWKGITEDDGNISEVYENVVLDTLLKCAKESGKEKLLITMSDVSSAVSMYRGLCSVRNKKAPGLYELYDSVQSCFVKGELNAASDVPLRILSEIATGNEIGSLCSTAEKIPVIQDFEEQCRKYRLKVDNVAEQEIELDIFSKPTHMEISRLFYKMNYLKTGFAKRLKGADIINNKDRSRIRETWSYKRTVNTDSSLIDVSVYGATIEEVCKTMSSRQIKDEQKCSDAAKLYVECFLMGIGISDKFEAKLDEIIINDGDFFSLGKGLYYFNMLDTLKKMYNAKGIVTEYFLEKCFQKIIIMLPSMMNVDSDHANECIKICRMMYNLVTGDILNGEYGTLFDTFRDMTEKENPEPSLYGAVLGLLYGSDNVYKENIKQALNAYLTGSETIKKQGAVFLRGLFTTARDIVLVGNEFIVITDKLISELEINDFMEILPELRLAFSYFTPSEIDGIAEKVALLYGKSKEDIKKTVDIYKYLYAEGIHLESDILRRIDI